MGLLTEDLTVGRNSELAGKTLGETRIRERTGVSIVGLKRSTTGIIPNLQSSTIFEAGDTVIALATKEQLAKLEPLVQPE